MSTPMEMSTVSRLLEGFSAPMLLDIISLGFVSIESTLSYVVPLELILSVVTPAIAAAAKHVARSMIGAMIYIL